MSTLSVYLLGIGSALLVLPAAVVLAEVLLGILPMRRCVAVHGRRPRVAVLVPAHNEAASIVGMLRSIAAQLHPRDRLIVVADNCVDQTAQLAAREGGEVVVRRDESHRGKGYALDAGIRYLQKDAPEVVISIDADSSIESEFIDRLARRCAALGRPVQARYLMLPHGGAPLRTRLAAFAWIVKNDLRPSGLHRLGLPCQLMGSGMAFPWPCISTARLSSGHIVEDLKLGIELALRGSAAAFYPEVTLTSSFPVSPEGFRTQRARWEHGHLGVILSEAPNLMWQALRRGDIGLLALALDLCVPPLALLTLAMLTACAADGVLAGVAGSLAPLSISLVGLGMLAAAVLLAWARATPRVASFGTLALCGLYALGKLPLYFRFLVARQTQWVRSRRDGEHA